MLQLGPQTPVRVRAAPTESTTLPDPVETSHHPTSSSLPSPENPAYTMSSHSSDANDDNPLRLREQRDLSQLLAEIHRDQAAVLTSLQDANWRFDDAGRTFDLDKEAQIARVYMDKLRTMRRIMLQTKQRLAKLQQRSVRVRDTAKKRADDVYREWREDTEYQQQLVAKLEPNNDPIPRSHRPNNPDSYGLI